MRTRAAAAALALALTGAAAKSKSANMVYHQGSVISHPRAFVSFWNVPLLNGNPVDANGNIQAARNVLVGLGGTRYAGVVEQYQSSTSAIHNESYSPNYWIDSTPWQAGAGHPDMSEIEAAVQRVADHFPYIRSCADCVVVLVGDSNWMYSPYGEAFHLDVPNGSNLSIPYAAIPSGAMGDNPDGVTPAVAHELLEMITDPRRDGAGGVLGGWYENAPDGEIADKAAPMAHIGVQLVSPALTQSGTVQLPAMWSNQSQGGNGGSVYSYLTYGYAPSGPVHRSRIENGSLLIDGNSAGNPGIALSASSPPASLTERIGYSRHYVFSGTTLWECYYNEGSGSCTWTSLGTPPIGIQSKIVTAVSWGAGRVDVFAGYYWYDSFYRRYNYGVERASCGDGAWSGWVDVPPPPTGFGQYGLGAASRNPKSVSLYALDAQSPPHLWKMITTDAWNSLSSPVDLGNAGYTLGSTPNATASFRANSGDYEDVVIRSTAGHAIVVSEDGFGGHSWRDWGTPNHGYLATPSILNIGDGRLDVEGLAYWDYYYWVLYPYLGYSPCYSNAQFGAQVLDGSIGSIRLTDAACSTSNAVSLFAH